ncbi:MAG: hypothetical protein D3916_00825 [Candidatus Electrothrix sp. MAN1_4]|nr:hypothetical protein [Candidatus Electrothrix sp. MAN1_4]
MGQKALQQSEEKPYPAQQAGCSLGSAKPLLIVERVESLNHGYFFSASFLLRDARRLQETMNA